MTAITVQLPITIAAPRASRWAASAFTGILNWFELHSAARAERQMQADRATEAAAVRNYAQRYASHDPRFAADLLAAADRHEQAL
jgi:hypothetical protein